MARRNAPVTCWRLWAHSKMATYWLKNHLLTPRNGRRKFRTPVQIPSIVLSWTSRMPSPSSSRAHSRRPGVWQTVGWARPVAGRRSYACHSSVLTVAPGCVWASTNGCRVARSRWRHTCQGFWPLSRPTTPAIGTRSVSQLPCPRALCARRRGGSRRAACWRPFSPAFWDSSSAAVTSSSSGPRGGKALFHQALDLMASRQQMPTINPQFLGQVLGRYPLGDAPQDLDDGRAAIAALRPDRAREEIEDGPAGAAAVFQNGGAMPIMRRLIGEHGMSGGTVQPIWVQGAEEEVMASLFIQQRIEGKLQHRYPSLAHCPFPGMQQRGCRRCLPPQNRHEPEGQIGDLTKL